MQKLIPCLWFDDQAEEAAKFYTSTFNKSKIGKMARYSEAGAEVSGRKQGSVMTVEFDLEGYKFTGLNGGPLFKFSPAISFFVGCESEKELDELWKSLVRGGSVLMELNKYPFAEKYGWCEDKYGVSWQLILNKTKQKITPSLLFVGEQAGRAEEAMKLYTSIFKNSKIENIVRDEKTNAILYAPFTLAGEEFVAMDSPIEHKFTFTHAISIMVDCKTQEEVDEIWSQLTKGGEAEPCGWVKDKFGVSWQIVPSGLGEMFSDPDSKKTERVMKAMLQMKKLDIKKLKQAYEHT
jgi:predicted 3-demethylubiquinone-9 3-methyltransferase (glyoxalase superfamily)